MKLVSVIVTTKNEEAVIARCLHSVKQQTYKKVELILVDNESTDQTQAIAKTFTKKVYVKGPERSAQRNYGAGKAKGDYYFFIDADMQLRPEVIENCVKQIQKGKEAVVVDEYFIGKGFWSKSKALEKSCYTGTGEGEAARFYTKQIFKKVKGYDEALTGPEDIDMHKRVAKYTTFGRTGIINHYDEYLTLQDLLRKRYYYSLSLKKYMQKHPEQTKGEFKFIRKAYIKNWKKLLSYPIYTAGFFFLRIGEGVMVLLAMRKTKKFNKR